MSESKKPPSAASTATEIGIALALAPPGTKAASARAVVAPKLMAVLQEKWQQRRDESCFKYLCAYLAGEPLEDEGHAEAELQALADDPKLRELVFDAFRVVDDAMAEEAVFVMGKLTRLYRTNGLQADRMSRGVRRIMQDVNSEDFAALREVLTAVTSVTSVRESVAVSFNQYGDAPLLIINHHPSADAAAATRATCGTKASARCTTRALDLLKAGLLAQEGASHNRLGMRGEAYMTVDLPAARTLLSLMP